MTFRSQSGIGGFRNEAQLKSKGMRLEPLTGLPSVPVENTWYTGYTGNAYVNQVDNSLAQSFADFNSVAERARRRVEDPSNRLQAMYTRGTVRYNETRATAKRLAPLSNGRRVDANNADRTDYSITPSMFASEKPLSPRKILENTLDDLMRSSKAIEIRFLKYYEIANHGVEIDEPTYWVRKQAVEEFPSMHLKRSQCNWEFMKEYTGYFGFRQCKRCGDRRKSKHTEMQLEVGMHEYSKDKYGVELHICKCCGYLTWSQYDEGWEDRPILDDFEGPDCFVYEQIY